MSDEIRPPTYRPYTETERDAAEREKFRQSLFGPGIVEAEMGQRFQDALAIKELRAEVDTWRKRAEEADSLARECTAALSACYGIAQRLDATDPEAPGAFNGTVAERLERSTARLLADRDRLSREVEWWIAHGAAEADKLAIALASLGTAVRALEEIANPPDEYDPVARDTARRAMESIKGAT